MTVAIADIIESVGNGEALRATELGKIKIGGLGASRQTQGGGTWRLPQKHDYFTITTLNRAGGDPKGDLIPDTKLMEQLVAAGFGDTDGKLRQIPVRVMSDDIEEVLQSRFVWYGGKTVAAKSDGKTVTWFHDPRTGKKMTEPVEKPWDKSILELKDAKGNKVFKLHTQFNCVIAAAESRFGGVYKFRTTSLVSFKQLYASLLHISQLTGGVLIGMPLVLVVRPLQVAPDGKPTTVYVVHAELRGAGMLELQRQAVEQMKWRLENKERLLTTQRQYQKLLVAPGDEKGAEAEDISAEFHPEASAPEPAPTHYSILDDAPASEGAGEGAPAAPTAPDPVNQVSPMVGGPGESDPLAMPGEDGAPSEIEKIRIMIGDYAPDAIKALWLKVPPAEKQEALKLSGLKSAVDDADVRAAMTAHCIEMRRKELAGVHGGV